MLHIDEYEIKHFEKFILPKCSQLLDCEIKDLYITCGLGRFDCWSSNDRIVNSYGLKDSLLSISKHNKSSSDERKYGISVKECNDIKYIIIHYRDEDTPRSLCVFKRKTLLKIARVWEERKDKFRSNAETPILNDCFLHDIINNSINFIKKCDKYKKYNTLINRGFIFSGKPGNGKTMMCRYLDSLSIRSNISYQVYSSINIEKAYNDDSLSELFSGENSSKPSIKIFDDIDISYFDRKGCSAKIACAILSAMDGINKNKKPVIRIFCTNEDTANFDPAFMRPGRIDRVFHFKNPTDELKLKFINTWHQDIISNIDVNKLINETKDFSFAKLSAIKMFLVSGFIDNEKWDLDKALSLCKEDEKQSKNKLGF